MWLKFHMAHRFVAEKCHWINLINSITLDLTWNVKNSSHLSPCFITDFFINTAMPIYLRNHTKVQYFDWYWSTLRFSNGGICPSIILWKKYVMTTKRDGKWFFFGMFFRVSENQARQGILLNDLYLHLMCFLGIWWAFVKRLTLIELSSWMTKRCECLKQ